MDMTLSKKKELFSVRLWPYPQILSLTAKGLHGTNALIYLASSFVIYTSFFTSCFENYSVIVFNDKRGKKKPWLGLVI
jgi:hypothetical protein